MSGPDVEVAVIGAGPYGLASTAFLRRAGADCLAIGEPMEFWQERMPSGMILRSRRRSSHIADPDGSLSLDAFAEEVGRERSDPVSLEEFVLYGQWYQQRAAPDLDPRRVAEVSADNGHFALNFDDGSRVVARRVVVATGLFPFAVRAPQLHGLAPEQASHSGDHADFSWSKGKDVLVVGSGQSALESAALLHEAGAAVEIVARKPSIVWLAAEGDPRLLARLKSAVPPPTDVGSPSLGWLVATPDVLRRAPARFRDRVSTMVVVPAGAHWLRQRLASVPMALGTNVTRVEQSGERVEVWLDDGTRREVDHLLSATGWQVDVRRYPFLAESLTGALRMRGGYPILNRGLESSLPGLHFVGAPASESFGPIMRFVVGTWYAGPVIARAAIGRRQRLARFSFRPRLRSLKVR